MSNDTNEVLARLFKLWSMVCKMVMDGKRDAGQVADCLQQVVDEPKVEEVVKSNEKFDLLNTFSVVVPQAYAHATRLDLFKVEHREEFYSYNDALTDANFAKATTKLEPGRKFKVKVFQVKERVTSEECMAHLRSQKATLVGAQGASLAYEQKKDELPVGCWSVSFDEKEALWDTDGGRGVPRVYRDSDGGFGFSLGNFEDGWLDGSCLLCFCDESSDA